MGLDEQYGRRALERLQDAYENRARYAPRPQRVTPQPQIVLETPTLPAVEASARVGVPTTAPSKTGLAPFTAPREYQPLPEKPEYKDLIVGGIRRAWEEAWSPTTPEPERGLTTVPFTEYTVRDIPGLGGAARTGEFVQNLVGAYQPYLAPARGFLLPTLRTPAEFLQAGTGALGEVAVGAATAIGDPSRAWQHLEEAGRRALPYSQQLWQMQSPAYQLEQGIQAGRELGTAIAGGVPPEQIAETYARRYEETDPVTQIIGSFLDPVFLGIGKVTESISAARNTRALRTAQQTLRASGQVDEAARLEAAARRVGMGSREAGNVIEEYTQFIFRDTATADDIVNAARARQQVYSHLTERKAAFATKQEAIDKLLRQGKTPEEIAARMPKIEVPTGQTLPFLPRNGAELVAKIKTMLPTELTPAAMADRMVARSSVVLDALGLHSRDAADLAQKLVMMQTDAGRVRLEAEGIGRIVRSRAGTELQALLKGMDAKTVGDNFAPFMGGMEGRAEAIESLQRLARQLYPTPALNPVQRFGNFVRNVIAYPYFVLSPSYPAINLYNNALDTVLKGRANPLLILRHRQTLARYQTKFGGIPYGAQRGIGQVEEVSRTRGFAGWAQKLEEMFSLVNYEAGFDRVYYRVWREGVGIPKIVGLTEADAARFYNIVAKYTPAQWDEMLVELDRAFPDTMPPGAAGAARRVPTPPRSSPPMADLRVLDSEVADDIGKVAQDAKSKTQLRNGMAKVKRDVNRRVKTAEARETPEVSKALDDAAREAGVLPSQEPEFAPVSIIEEAPARRPYEAPAWRPATPDEVDRIIKQYPELNEIVKRIRARPEVPAILRDTYTLEQWKALDAIQQDVALKGALARVEDAALFRPGDVWQTGAKAGLEPIPEPRIPQPPTAGVVPIAGRPADLSLVMKKAFDVGIYTQAVTEAGYAAAKLDNRLVRALNATIRDAKLPNKPFTAPITKGGKITNFKALTNEIATRADEAVAILDRYPETRAAREAAKQAAKPLAKAEVAAPKPLAAKAEAAAPAVAAPTYRPVGQVSTTMPIKRQISELETSIREGEMRLELGKDAAGRKLNAEQRASVQHAIDSARARVAELRGTVAAPAIGPGTRAAETAIPPIRASRVVDAQARAITAEIKKIEKWILEHWNDPATPIAAPAGYNAHRVVFDFIASPEFRGAMNDTFAIGKRAGVAARNFVLHDYIGGRYNFDTMLAYGLPFHFWMTREGATYLTFLLRNPQFAAAYAAYRKELEEINKDIPEQYRDMIGITTPFGKVYFNIETALNPLNRHLTMLENLINPERMPSEAVAQFMRPFPGVEFGLRKAGVLPEGLAEETGRIGTQMMQTAAIQSFTALLKQVGVNSIGPIPIPPGGINIEKLPFDVAKRLGLDLGITPENPYDPTRIGRQVVAMQQRGEITLAQAEEAMLAQRGAIWDKAKTAAYAARVGSDVPGALVGLRFNVIAPSEKDIEDATRERRAIDAAKKAGLGKELSEDAKFALDEMVATALGALSDLRQQTPPEFMGRVLDAYGFTPGAQRLIKSNPFDIQKEAYEQGEGAIWPDGTIKLNSANDSVAVHEFAHQWWYRGLAEQDQQEFADVLRGIIDNPGKDSEWVARLVDAVNRTHYNSQFNPAEDYAFIAQHMMGTTGALPRELGRFYAGLFTGNTKPSIDIAAESLKQAGVSFDKLSAEQKMELVRRAGLELPSGLAAGTSIDKLEERFQAKYPWYYAYSARYRDAPERAVAELRNAYYERTELERRTMRDTFGGEFYDVVRGIGGDPDPVKVAAWLAALGKLAPVELPTPQQKIQAPAPVPAHLSAAYALRNQMAEKYGGWDKITTAGNEYYALPQGSQARRNYLKQNPWLAEWWTWQRALFAQYPELGKLLGREEQETTYYRGVNPANVRGAYADSLRYMVERAQRSSGGRASAPSYVTRPSGSIYPPSASIPPEGVSNVYSTLQSYIQAALEKYWDNGEPLGTDIVARLLSLWRKYGKYIGARDLQSFIAILKQQRAILARV